jgi:hypothetical protein
MEQTLEPFAVDSDVLPIAGIQNDPHRAVSMWASEPEIKYDPITDGGIEAKIPAQQSYGCDFAMKVLAMVMSRLVAIGLVILTH